VPAASIGLAVGQGQYQYKDAPVATCEQVRRRICLEVALLQAIEKTTGAYLPRLCPCIFALKAHN
jgi:hypothetical protein